MRMPKNLSRRSMLQLGVGGVGALGGSLMAATPADAKCATPPQIEGPFYPKRAQLDTDTDLTVIQGRANRAEGDVIAIRGQVLDNQLHPVAGTSSRSGRRTHAAGITIRTTRTRRPRTPPFRAGARSAPNTEGALRLQDDRPGRVPHRRRVVAAAAHTSRWRSVATTS